MSQALLVLQALTRLLQMLCTFTVSNSSSSQRKKPIWMRASPVRILLMTCLPTRLCRSLHSTEAPLKEAGCSDRPASLQTWEVIGRSAQAITLSLLQSQWTKSVLSLHGHADLHGCQTYKENINTAARVLVASSIDMLDIFAQTTCKTELSVPFLLSFILLCNWLAHLFAEVRKEASQAVDLHQLPCVALLPLPTPSVTSSLLRTKMCFMICRMTLATQELPPTTGGSPA